jgi:hypothetical protein
VRGMRKKLGICGDSFMAAINKSESNPNNGYDKHFTEILGKKLNCDVVTFAKGGVSNQTIRLQIEEVIKENPDHVIIGTTTPDRLEIPIPDLRVNNYYDKFEEKNYNPFNSLYNIKYIDSLNNQSQNHSGFNLLEPTMISETMSNVLNTKKHQFISNRKKKALIEYFDLIYDHEWKTQQDSWILCEGLYKLKKRGISFDIIIFNLHLHYFDEFKEHIIGPEDKLNPWKYYDFNIKSPYSFHLLEEDEILLADLWYKKLNKKFRNDKLI